MARRLKSYLPRSIFGRALLIIILPIVIMQILVAYFFFNAHWSRVTANLTDSVAGDISVAVQLFEQTPTLEQAESLDILMRPDMQLSVAFREGDSLPTSDRRAFFSALDRTLRRALDQSLDRPFWFDTTRYPNYIDVRVEVEGGILRFIAARDRVFAPTGYVFILLLILATVALSLVSVLFIRRQADPIQELAQAATAFGKGQDISDFKPRGASEVRRAGHAFLRMRKRISRHLEQRALLLAGISHDLRTPLTRLKLQLSMLEGSEDLTAAKRDLDEMEAMLGGYLDFARGLESEPPEDQDLRSFIEGLSARFPEVEIGDVDTISVAMRVHSLDRALSNLLSNARKYADHTRLSADITEAHVIFHVDDDGPGIPEEKRRDAQRAFTRLDAARNQNVEGVGLGLAIARDIAQIHGGALVLSDSPMGGLRASVSLPR